MATNSRLELAKVPAKTWLLMQSRWRIPACGITPKWTLFPIPLTVINLNSEVVLEQNPGWD